MIRYLRSILLEDNFVWHNNLSFKYKRTDTFLYMLRNIVINNY